MIENVEKQANYKPLGFWLLPWLHIQAIIITVLLESRCLGVGSDDNKPMLLSVHPRTSVIASASLFLQQIISTKMPMSNEQPMAVFQKISLWDQNSPRIYFNDEL